MSPYVQFNKFLFKQIRQPISIIILAAFLCSSVNLPVFAQAASQEFVPRLPEPGMMVNLSPSFTPAYLSGMSIYPDNPFKFDFLVTKGDQSLDPVQKKAEYNKLIKYFLASLTIPNTDQWVNLSPSDWVKRFY